MIVTLIEINITRDANIFKVYSRVNSYLKWILDTLDENK